ncbi:MAG: hypothetical protein JO340_16950 [Acidobacteriaceae bacterium]|nr:hypothetical protein [Acidobacteriaceae bacterium]
MLSRFRFACRLFLSIGLVSYFGSAAWGARWTELNIGPFYVDTDGDGGEARDALTQLEQLRWVLGGMLESKDLPSVWPIRVVLTSSQKGAPAGHFVWRSGEYLMVGAPGTHVPLGEVSGILLDENTPRLPPEIEAGLRELFETLQAHGSRVTWGGAPAHPDLAWARMQLFATRFEYGSSFHIFMQALKGSTLRAAEQNAFGKDYKLLEQQAAENLASGNWQPATMGGRPLDPKRDFGEHSLEAAIAAVYLADAHFAADPAGAEAAYKAAVEAKGEAAALGFEGLAHVAEREHENPKPFLDDAIHAGSKSAPVYVSAADGLDAEAAVPLLKKAAQLNPLWAEPVFKQAEFASATAQKEALLKQAIQLDPRATEDWLELAKVQAEAGEASAAQGTWLRAEDSAPTAEERDRIHKMRLDSEQERLDAAEQARRRDREAAHLDDERAQQAELDRIRAAEAKANRAADAQAGTDKPENAVPWDQVVKQKKLAGMLIQVDCLRTATRLIVKDKTGAIVALLLRQSLQTELGCGAQKPPRRVTVAYSVEADDQFHTVGTVVGIELQ